MKQILRNLLRCERGNVALLFGLSLLPLLAQIGIELSNLRVAY